MSRILVTGATGNIGRLLVDDLLAAGAEKVRALTANPAKAALPPQVEVVEGYLGRIGTVPAALEGIDRMYLAPVPGTVEEVMTLARAAGIRRIADLSGPEGSWWHTVAQAVEESGIEWTHLWPGEFMSNTLVWADQIRSTGVVRDAYPTSANAPIAMEDVAAVAAAVLLEDGHVGEAYSMTGPETLTRAEMVRLIGEALGRDIPFVELAHEEAIEELSATMGDYAIWYVEGMAELAEHPQAAVPTVEEIIGRPAITYAQWAITHANELS